MEMLRNTLLGAKPAERVSIEETIRIIREQKIVASTGSEFSLWFQHVIGQFEPLFRPEIVVALRETPIFGVQLPMVNAFARKDRMVIFEGLLDVARFFWDYTWVVNLLLQEPASGKKIRLSGSAFLDMVEMDEATAFGYACWLLLEHFAETKAPLPFLGDLLGPNAQKCSMNGYVSTVAFVMAHELGHIVLGHTSHGETIARRNYVLAVGEPLGNLKEQELAADEFAIQSFREEYRSIITLSGLTFCSQRGFMDSLGERTDHPLGINRVWNVHDLMANGAVYKLPEITEVLTNLHRAMEVRVEGFEQMARLFDLPTTPARDVLRQLMPASTALEIIQQVRQRIEAAAGVLDTTPISNTAR